MKVFLGYGAALVLFIGIIIALCALMARVIAPYDATTGGPVSYHMAKFDMVDQHGKPVNEAAFIGKPALFYFGYTYCPVACPTTLTHLTAWLKRLGPQADRLKVAFVTVDPERDTPKALTQYLTSFDSRITGLTGTPAQVARMAKGFYVFYQKIPLGEGDYSMDHSSNVFLFDTSGQFKGTIDEGEPDQSAFEKLQMLTDTNAAGHSSPISRAKGN